MIRIVRFCKYRRRRVISHITVLQPYLHKPSTRHVYCRIMISWAKHVSCSNHYTGLEVKQITTVIWHIYLTRIQLHGWNFPSVNVDLKSINWNINDWLLLTFYDLSESKAIRLNSIWIRSENLIKTTIYIKLTRLKLGARSPCLLTLVFDEAFLFKFTWMNKHFTT